MNPLRKVADSAALAAALTGALGAAVALGAALAPPAAAIVGGERVASRDAPWAVSLLVQAGREARWHHRCSATVIAPRRVVTARHCVEHQDAWRARAMVGSDDPERRPGRTVAVSRIWVSALLDWDDPGVIEREGDVAVIETASDIPAPALPLAAPGTTIAGGETVWPYGFGRIDREGRPTSEPALLRRAVMRGHTEAECAESDFGDQSSLLCASRAEGAGGGTVAPGDSGGGLVHQGASGPELLGVTSVASRGELRDEISGFVSIPLTHAFVTDPARGVELPRPLARSTLKGRARVGERVRCMARFAPVVTRVRTRWTVTGKGARALRYTSGAKGLRLPAATLGRTLTCYVVGELRFEEYGAAADPSRPVEVKR
ncbi:S1 family peptidase [Conexibacter woesei]|uniref:Peptidase S1 and S6 chymotrypsin/Hap n=1 Tax=Conexibacter woesei (strain DSM 14684 / CCUG 47730 / CIP 108061 / JCM 11494 / NBRC 100937 / ID131577) TaxID=469383 RepID=D3F7E0_CONWI|nr:trypsin-like serine protease [Conexibacter woesei]ADB48911.1 peptidase S1 and S6 chymotrypsin/Hap [Conexibacter woesei DSM 14684]